TAAVKLCKDRRKRSSPNPGGRRAQKPANGSTHNLTKINSAGSGGWGQIGTHRFDGGRDDDALLLSGLPRSRRPGRTAKGADAESASASRRARSRHGFLSGPRRAGERR